MTTFSAITKAVEFITGNEPYLEFIIYSQKQFIKINYYRRMNAYQLFQYKQTYIFSKKALIRYLLLQRIENIKMYNKMHRKNYFDEYIYNSKLIYIIKIQKGYRKYRLRTARIRNDLVIRGLSELWYHPSKLSFEC